MLTLKLFYRTADNYTEETRPEWTFAEVQEYARSAFELNDQIFTLYVKSNDKKINNDRELSLVWRPYCTRSGDAQLRLKVVAAAPPRDEDFWSSGDDEMEVEEEEEEAPYYPPANKQRGEGSSRDV